MSSKMSQKTQTKISKEKRSEDKFDRAIFNVKRISVISCCLVVALIGVGLFVSPKKSYAAGFLTEIPDKFISYVKNGDGASQSVNNNLIAGIGLPWEFSGYEANLNDKGGYSKGNKISFIYCVDRQKDMASDIIYSKDHSVKSPISLDLQGITKSYPGMIYIVLNDSIVDANSLPIVSGQTEETMNYYLAQVAIWYYIDKVNGTDHNFTSEEKALIDSSLYGPIINNLVTNALSYNPGSDSNNSITIDSTSISYSIMEDYIETSVITPLGSNTYFENYRVQVADSNSNAKILDVNGNEINGVIDANTGFKVRIPLSETQNNDFDLKVSVVGYFSNSYDAYLYIPDNGAAQRAILGKVEKMSTPTSFYLKAPVIDVPDTNSTSFLVYGIGSFIVIAGIVLIVVAKKPKNAKNK